MKDVPPFTPFLSPPTKTEKNKKKKKKKKKKKTKQQGKGKEVFPFSQTNNPQPASNRSVHPNQSHPRGANPIRDLAKSYTTRNPCCCIFPIMDNPLMVPANAKQKLPLLSTGIK